MIIVIANNKGGVGKSSIAVHLAAWLHEQGYKVILVDCDRQQSSSEWLQEAIPSIRTVRLSSSDEIINELPLLREEADFIVGDGPGSDTDLSRCLLMRTDFALIPCKASMLEVRALHQATDVLRQAQDVRKGPPAAVGVLSMVGKHYRLTKDMREAAAILKLPLANVALTLRQVYADAPGQGALVWQMGSRGKEAGDEIKKLFQEILPNVRVMSAKRKATQRVSPEKKNINRIGMR